jgi:hypothetical protein
MMWCWQVHEGGEWNIIAAVLGGALTPLVTTREGTFDMMRSLAEVHGLVSGLPVRGARYGEPEHVEALT